MRGRLYVAQIAYPPHKSQRANSVARALNNWTIELSLVIHVNFFTKLCYSSGI